MLADAIASLGATAYTVRARTANAVDSLGRAVPPTVTTGTITGLLQPMTGAEVARLPEGLHQKELRAFWTTGNLGTPDSDAGTVGDHIVGPNGTEWEAVLTEGWNALGGFTRYVLSRVDP